MNLEKLHQLIDIYEENFYLINNQEHDEIFKWRAVKYFRDIWFSEDYTNMLFSHRFHLAMKKSSVLINNKMITPTEGIVKLAEEFPEVETLFQETLFSGESDPQKIQENMERFLEETEKLRQKKFPRYYRYKQERHAASCYLAFYEPEKHFIYRYSEAEAFAVYVEFGKDLGSGASFSLPNYYEMANMIVEALKEHPSLIEKHKALIQDAPKYYRDESLHLMAFDLMYCCKCYRFYPNGPQKSKKESIRAYTLQKQQEKEEAEKKAQIAQLEEDLYSVEMELEPYEDISLLDVEVTVDELGTGIVVEHDHDMIKVQFENIIKSYFIDRKYSRRPTFENDDVILDAYDTYRQLAEKRKRLQKQLAKMKS